MMDDKHHQIGPESAAPRNTPQHDRSPRMSAPDRPDTVDERLEYLADHLDYPMAERLLQLLDASSSVHELVELRHRVERADDLVAELRRHLAVRDRQLREAELAAAR